MTCREFLELLTDYVDGALPSEQAERCDAHRAECDDCRGYLESYRRTRELLREAGGAEVPHLPEDLVRAILEARRKKRR